MQSNNEPLVAIYMITYNHENYIGKAIASAMSQKTNFLFKLFIGDDCSKDNTRSICLEWKNKYPEQIELLFHDVNIGPNMNAKITFDSCHGSGAKYIAMLEGDDAWNDPHKLQQQVDYLEKHPEISVVWHDYEFIDQNDTPLEPQPTKGYLKSYTSDELKGITSIKTLTVCYRVPFPKMPEEHLQCPNGDTFLFAVLGRFGGAHFLPNIRPAKYRMHTGGIWSKQNTRHRDVLALKSYDVLASYFGQFRDVKAQMYYVDRSIKTQYLLSYEDRAEGKWFNSLLWSFKATRMILAHGKIKSLPHVWLQFVRIVCFGKNVSWALRQTPNSQ